MVGVLFRAASAAPVNDEVLQRIEALLGIDGTEVMRYQDRQRGQRRTMRMVRSDSGLKLEAFLLAGDIGAEAWIRPLLQEELAADVYGRALLSPGSKPPVAVASKGRQVCTCFNVSEPAIVEALGHCQGNTDERLASLQGALKCGTNCGSCIPELRKLIKLHPLPVATPS
jgi:assimilatory nitrate reductase catalytic subunit